MMPWSHGREWLFMLACVPTLVAGGGCAARQPARSFPDLQDRLRPGQTVYVIDAAERETRGTVVGVSVSGLTLDVDGAQTSVGSAGLREVQRYGDSVWNGAVIGLAVGGGSALMSDPRSVPCPNDPQSRCKDYQTGQRVLAAVVMGALGAGIDALIRGRHTVYLAPERSQQTDRRIRVTTRLGPSGAGVFVTIAAR